MTVVVKLGGGSNSGITFTKGYLQCPQRALLDLKASLENRPGAATNAATTKGLIGHGLFELASKRGSDFSAEELSDLRVEHGGFAEEPLRAFDGAEAEAVTEARRLYLGAVSKGLGCSAFGETIGAELSVETSALGEIFERPGLTAKIDRLLRVDDVEAVREVLGIQIYPGLWVLDYKFHSRMWPAQEVEDRRNPQGIVYPVAASLWGAANGLEDERIAGTIFAHVIGNKEVKVMGVAVPYPSEERIEGLRASVFRPFARFVSDPLLREWKNHNACTSFGKLCRYAEDGTCT